MDPSKPKDQSIEDGDGQGEKSDVKVDEDPRWVGPATVEIHACHLFGLQKVLQVLPAIKNNSERPVDALAVKNIPHPLTDNFKSRDAASATKNISSNKNHIIK